MLLIGSADRNIGKTDLACSVLRELSPKMPIAALKVTTVTHNDGTCPRGGKGCGVCSSLKSDYLITEETSTDSPKDTCRMLAAGASPVLWLRALQAKLPEAAEAVLARLDPDTVLVCESNRLRRVVEPGLFVMIRKRGSTYCKASAAAVQGDVDRTVFSDGERFDLYPADFAVAAGRWALREDAAAIVLAGGDSLRMGCDKGLLPVNGQPLIQHLCQQLSPHFSQILISARTAGEYSFLGHRVVADQAPGQGPLMGLASALRASQHDTNLVVACDIPAVDMGLVRRMLRLAREHDCVVPRDRGQYEPLFAVYRRSVVNTLDRMLVDGVRRIQELYELCDTAFLDLEEHEQLVNLNTMQDYETFLARSGAYQMGRRIGTIRAHYPYYSWPAACPPHWTSSTRKAKAEPQGWDFAF